MSKFEESNFYKALQDFFINADKKTFLQFLAEFYNRTEGIIDKDNIQDDLIKELRELYLEFNEKGIDENIVREKVNYFLENSVKIKDIISKLTTNTNNIENITSQLETNTNEITQFVVTSDDIQSKIDSIPVLLKKKEIVIDKNLVLTKPIKLKDSIKLKGIDGVEITGDNIIPFLHSGGGLKNITIENLTFNGTNSFELEGIEVINIKNCKFKNIKGVGLGWLKGCKYVNIINNIIQDCSNMGMKIEGTSYGESTVVNVKNNLVINSGDNGIAVRAMNGNIKSSNISGNTIINAGKAGIKLTIETASNETSTITDCVISNNIINGWGSLVHEDAISCNNYKTSYNLNNVSIMNNVISSMPENEKQRGYIGVSKCKNVSVIGNNCRGSVLWNGIWCEILREATIIGNRIEGACQDSSYQYISSCGGIGLIYTENSSISNNIIKNTGTINVNRPGIIVNKSRFNTIMGNRCFDDQDNKTQSRGIDETNNGGTSEWSQNNIFIGNICLDNIEVSIYSSRSVNSNNLG